MLLSRFLLAVFSLLLLVSCHNSSPSEEAKALHLTRKSDYIRAIPGEDQELSVETVHKGKVLISYSDCYVCHKENRKVIGPSFRDIALRYPINEVFIEILAQRVILGGTGAWGHSYMSPHSSLTKEDARAMVSYILSYKEK